MSITHQSSSSIPGPSLDHLIEYTELSIKKQAATVQHLASEGHEVTDARQQLTQMMGNLAALIQMKTAAS
jgi:hypothetical protein